MLSCTSTYLKNHTCHGHPTSPFLIFKNVFLYMYVWGRHTCGDGVPAFWGCFSFYLYVGSWDWTQVARLTQRASLPTEPSVPSTHLTLQFAAWLTSTPSCNLEVSHSLTLPRTPSITIPKGAHWLWNPGGMVVPDVARTVPDHSMSLRNPRVWL